MLIHKRYQVYQKLCQFEGGQRQLSRARFEVRLDHFDQKVGLGGKNH
jgi:hypothetical protein